MPDRVPTPAQALVAGPAADGAAGGDALHVRTPRSVTAVPMLRKRARAWLRAVGVDGAVAEAVLLATGEAVSNAVEHAYPPDGEGDVELTMSLGSQDHPGDVLVSVVDAGRWRPAPADAGFRGRGLAMIRALADSAETTTGPHGTSVRMRWN
jgi:anti-sigma regulatory factor (Ser/Thr protein kinase)